MKRKNVKQALTDALDIPREIVLDVPRIVLDSNRAVWVENYKGIISYEPAAIKINTHQYILCVHGQNLNIRSMTGEELHISGTITSLEYQ